ncbi:CDP-2,3-bis-(O-geranylgeranyl)-sn-glycerol synthase [Methanothermococcus sp. SCGC AD-155-E23]|nr:CDP-2,3-bis-(O-geranylgeranyl)-sn-glycerol synthase [Methanothermococcus sp. SCGC AD-155-E23]
MDLIQLIFKSLLYILPAYVANAAACIFGGGTPVDLGRKFLDGRRILGNGVTYRGFFFGLLFGCITATLEGILLNLDLVGTSHFYYKVFKWLCLGFLLSLGALFGDMVGSFIKRRLGIERGKPAPLLDQLDFVLFAILFAYPFAPITLEMVVIILVITPLIHLSGNIVAYLLGIKSMWW